MANTPRVVCWANRDEWTEIYQCLYSFDDVNLQRKGVDRVIAWKSRSGGKLPLSIECTLDLVLAHLADSQAFTPEVQLILSIALVRFVNGMVDLNQKGLYARSVQAIAEEIGLPDWMVDLRHEATHANLPSQHTLRAGVHVALSWLREEYWEAQIKMHKDSEDKLGEMIDSYQALCAKKKKKKKKNIEKQEQKIKVVAQEITDFVSINNLWSYLQVLLLKNGLRTEIGDGELSSTTQDQTATSSSQLSDEEIKNWKPLFEALDKESPDFLPFFLVSILDPQSDDMENDIPKNQLMPWVLWVLQSCSTFTAKLPWLTLLDICLKNPNPFTREFVTLILNEMPSVPGSLKQDILSLINIDLVEDSFEKFPDEAYECKSLGQIFNRSGSKCALQPVQENDLASLSSGWSVSKGETKWKLIPFGEVLGCDHQSSNLLELPELFIHQSEINNDNSTICKDVVGDVDFTEEDIEMINGYDESDLLERLSSEDDAVICNKDSIMDDKVSGVSSSLNNKELEAEICLF